MKQIYLSILLLFTAAINTNAQVMYSEDFDATNVADGSGVEGSSGSVLVNVGDYPALVDWTIDASAADLSASSDWAKTDGGQFAFRDTDGDIIWDSELIDISIATGAFNFSVDASNNNGGFEDSDYLDVLYSIDGGAFVLIQDWNGLGDTTHTFLGEKNGMDWDGSTPEVVTVSGLNGSSTLQIRVIGNVNAGGEQLFFDNINVFEGAPAPSISITSPADNEVLASGDFNVSFLVNNFTVAQTGGDGYVQYSLDSASATDKFDTTDILFTGITSGQHSITLELVDNTGTPLTPAVLQTVNFEVAGALQVQDLAELRAINLPSTDVITVAGEVFVTHTESFRNQKWVQDASAGILIDDNAGIITTSIVKGDGLTGITGTISEFNGLLQFTPTADTGAPTSTNNMPAPQVVTLAMLNTNAEDYESELVQINGLMFDNADGTIAFSNGSEEPISVGTDTFVHRSLFNTDYIGLPLPTAATDLVGFITERVNGYSVQARDRSDVSTLSNETFETNTFKIYPNPATGNFINIVSSNGEAVNVVIYSTLGQKVLAVNALTNTLNVGNLDSGMYIVRISQGEATQTRKLVIK
ncbi:MAG: T9SS type A sorting domain-containing protein [Nonlabens sp.]|uniref:T9SS type A sorting domain-containing protein n=1 Tax=Nonlabens sp. TaxID=1888209 RepID=UPI00321B6297